MILSANDGTDRSSSIAALPQPYPRPAAILRDKLHAGCFQGGADGIDRSGIQAFATLKASDGTRSDIRHLGDITHPKL